MQKSNNTNHIFIEYESDEAAGPAVPAKKKAKIYVAPFEGRDGKKYISHGQLGLKEVEGLIKILKSDLENILEKAIIEFGK